MESFVFVFLSSLVYSFIYDKLKDMIGNKKTTEDFSGFCGVGGFRTYYILTYLKICNMSIYQYFSYICINYYTQFLCLNIEEVAPKLAPDELYFQT